MGISLFLLGLIVGSFLNVLAFRYNPEGAFFSWRKWGGRSHCLFCAQKLHWYELIPVISFLAQEGRCLVCRAKLAWQYPLVELASGLAFWAPYYFHTIFYLDVTDFNNWVLISGFWTFIFLIFILIWAIDARLSVIPDELNILLGVAGLALIDLTSAHSWTNHFTAALVGGGLLGLIVYATRGRAMGLGDVKLAAALGLVFGWPDIFFVLALSFIFGAVAGIYLLALKKKGLKDAVPFGPFLILGSLAMFFFGPQIMQSYLQLFGI